MLKYTINRRKTNKTKVELTIQNIYFVDFENLVDEQNQSIGYDGNKKGKLMVTCECTDVDKLMNGSFINAVNILHLNYGLIDDTYEEEYIFNEDYQVTGVNKGNRSFSFYIDKYFSLIPSGITSSLNYGFDDYFTGGESNKNNIFLSFDDVHYFDIADNATNSTDQEIPIYFKYANANGETVVTTIDFKYYSPKVLVTSYDNFTTEEQKALYVLIFKSNIEEDKQSNTQKEGDLSGIDIYRDNFLFGDRVTYHVSFERAVADINVPIVNTFETTLFQMELLNEHFVEAEKKKAINKITDIEKDVYYPCISNASKTEFTDVYTMKFNLHFREHRGDDWLVENESFWNCVELDNSGKAQIVKAGNKKMTDDRMSDLLTFLGFTNNDVHYQKNKLKKSFLRLMYFDSMNPGNQNMLGYSTIFFDSGDMFAKYIRYIEKKDYIGVGADKKEYGKYTPMEGKVGIRVDRESFNDDTRLSSQLVVKNKNMSKASSEGFYLYIWKDNEMALPQDLYMKVEFNHAGYGRTIPFMMPYWDKKKWNDSRSGIKTFQEILNDWNDTKSSVDSQGKVIWANNTDGHYGIRQYTKFSYIHLKYQYDKENDRHLYYLDPDTYGNIIFPTDDDGNKYIEINLYEAKVE